MSVSGNTVERFDALEADFRQNPPGRADFARPGCRRPRPYSPVRPSAGSCRKRSKSAASRPR